MLNKKKMKKNKINKNVSDDNFATKVFRKKELDQEIEEKNSKSEKELLKEIKEDNKENIKKAKKRKKRKFIILIFLIIIIISGILLGIESNNWKLLATQMIINENSIVIDTDGSTIAKLGCERKSMPVSSNDMPSNLKNAYVAIEDERYYSHGGVDVKRTGGAILSYIFNFGSSSYGGSTISQQLVKNLTGDSSDSITRKVKEWWKAWQLEECLSKDEILEGYLNIIYVGPNIYGVEAGSLYYFSKSSKELSLEECAFLAGINNSPNSYNPFKNANNTEKIEKRTKTVLYKMLELGYIDDSSYNQAIINIDKGLKFEKGQIASEEPVYSYHTDALILEITGDIAKKYNISETFATNYINMAGLTISSTQNSKIQKQIETEFKKNKYSLASKNGGNSSQAAMVIIDHKTGSVLGCVGGLGKKTTIRPLNRATQSIRQTGSSIKPLAVLAPGINKKIITAATILDDTERDFADGYHPTDYTSALGEITVRRAIESSQNIPFVEVMEKITPKNSIKYLEKMGITTLTEEDNNLVLALGGLQDGISPLEMAGGYATIANDGEYIEPTFYIQINNKSGETIVKTKQKKMIVFSKEVAYILKNLLTEPVTGSNGTATYCAISGIDVAAKTGTTDNNYDRWLCGFTPYYTAVTWYGYDQNESINYNKKNPAGLLWANVMSRIHTGLQTAKFEKPNTVQTATICTITGKKANTGCPNTYIEYFLWSTVPDDCNEHSGSELKNNNSTDITNKVNEIIQGITEDIDVEEKILNQNITDTNQVNEIIQEIIEDIDIKEKSLNQNTTNTNSNITTNTNSSTSNSSNITNTKTNSTNTNSDNNSNTSDDISINTDNTSISSNTQEEY